MSGGLTSCRSSSRDEEAVGVAFRPPNQALQRTAARDVIPLARVAPPAAAELGRSAAGGQRMRLANALHWDVTLAGLHSYGTRGVRAEDATLRILDRVVRLE